MLARRTPLYGTFKALGGRMIDRPGYLVPEYFSDPKEEHLATRQAAGLFEIFGQFFLQVEGPEAEAFLQRLVVADMSRLTPGRVVYCTILNNAGGVIDDVTIFRVTADKFWIVASPARAVVVEAYLRGEARTGGPNIVLLGYKYTSLSLQGPRSRKILQEFVDIDLSTKALPYFSFVQTTLAGAQNSVVSRTGFTGELGYEIFIPTEYVETFYGELVAAGAKNGLLPCGLTAMNNLRLEKKYFIYGRDFDDKVTPVELGLGWTIKLTKPHFVGREVVEKQLQSGTKRQFVLLEFAQNVAPPPPAQVVQADGRDIGRVTTSGIGHAVGKTLALAAIDSAYAADGNTVLLPAASGEAAKGSLRLKAVYDPDNRLLRT